MTKAQKCAHEHGDTILGMWVCGQCYSKLDERPTRYVMQRSEEWGTQRPPRQIAIKAPISEVDGVRLSTFIGLMAARLMARTRPQLTEEVATRISIEVLASIGEPFGAPDIAWDQGGARELIDEEMSYWDADGAAAN